jgi:hypothetical protein
MGARKRALRSPTALGLDGGTRDPVEKARRRVASLQSGNQFAWKELYGEFAHYSKQFPSLNHCVCGHPKDEVSVHGGGKIQTMMVHNMSRLEGERACQYCDCNGFRMLVSGATLKGIRQIRSIRTIAGRAYKKSMTPTSWPRFEKKLAQAYRFILGRPTV